MSELAAALALVQTKLPEVAKTKTATVKTKDGGYTYDYADLAEVSRAILPLLGEAGLSWITKPMLRDDGSFVLEYKLAHASGESEEGIYPLPTTGSPQQIGSAITYARRYTLCAVTGIATTQEDDDGTAAEQIGKPATAQRRARTPQPRQPDESQTEQPPKRTAQRTAQRAAPAPPLPGEDGHPAPNLRTERQSTLIHTLFTNIDWGDRDDKLRAVVAIVGRPVGSTKELTVGEASKLIDELEPVAKSEDPQGAMLELLSRYQPAENGG